MDGARLRTWYPSDAAELWAAVAGLRQGKARQQAVGLNHPEPAAPADRPGDAARGRP